MHIECIIKCTNHHKTLQIKCTLSCTPRAFTVTFPLGSTVAVGAIVISSDHSGLLLKESLRFSYIWVAVGGWFYPLPVIIIEHAFPLTGFAVAWLLCSLIN